MSSFDPKFEVELEYSGRTLEVEDYELTQTFTGSVDTFEFTYYSQNPEDLAFLELQPVTIRINGRTQFIGRIDATEQGDSSAITCQGRNYIADLVECNVDPKVILKEGMTLQDAILLLCAPCGITAIESPGERISSRTGKVVNMALHPLTSKEVKDYKPKAGRGIYEVCSELLARFGLTMQPTIRRSAVSIQPPTYDQDSLGRLSSTKGGASGNLIISAKARRDYSSFPTSVIFTGKQGGAAEVGGAKGSITKWNMSDVLDVYPEELRNVVTSVIVQGYNDPINPKTVSDGGLYRLLYFQDDTGKTPTQNANAMMREISERLVETLVYTCTVRGHDNPVTGYTWSNDIIADIDDDMRNVHEPLWCRSVTMRNRKKGGGPTAQMTFVRPSTYQLFSET